MAEVRVWARPRPDLRPERGAIVIIASRNEEKLARAAREIGHNCQTAVLDMTLEKQVEDFFNNLGSLDHLLLFGAGMPAWGPLRDVTLAALVSAFQTKLMGYFLCAKHAAPVISQTGSLLFTIGGAARAAIPGTAGLAAINGGIAAMARTLARELAPIRCQRPLARPGGHTGLCLDERGGT